MKTTCEWNELFCRREYQAYGLVDIDLADGRTATVAAWVGVPSCNLGTAKAAGGACEAMCEAWYCDSSDYERCGIDSDEALSAISECAWSLLCAADEERPTQQDN